MLAAVFLCLNSGNPRAQEYDFSNNRPTQAKKEYKHLRLYVDYNWEKRPYLAYIPEHLRKHSVPLFVVLHAEDSNSVKTVSTSHFSELAEKNDFAVIYPEGKDGYWNAGKCCSNLSKEKKSPPDDVGYIKQVIKNFSKYQPIDKTKIFVLGFSNGGMMSYRVGCEMADKITGIGVIAGNLQVNDCKPTRPLDMIAVHAKDDENTPYFGGIPTEGPRITKIGGDVNDKPIMDTVLFWSNNALCSSFPLQTSGSRYSTYNCKSDSQYGLNARKKVKLILLEEGGHEWYGGGKQKSNRNLFSQDVSPINASSEIVEFFLDID